MGLLSITAKNIRTAFKNVLDRVEFRGEPIAITRNNEVAAVLVPYSDWKELVQYRAGKGPETIDETMDYLVKKNEKLFKALAE